MSKLSETLRWKPVQEVISPDDELKVFLNDELIGKCIYADTGMHDPKDEAGYTGLGYIVQFAKQGGVIAKVTTYGKVRVLFNGEHACKVELANPEYDV